MTICASDDDGQGKFGQSLEAFVDRLAIGNLEEDEGGKPRFVHAVMVMANPGGEEGLRIQARCIRQWDPYPETHDDVSGQEIHAKPPPDWDPIAEAVRVLQKTTGMLDEMLIKWAGEGDQRAVHSTGPPVSSDCDDAPASSDCGPLSPPSFSPPPVMPVAMPPSSSSSSSNGHRHPPLSSRMISFPSELRKYRMMATEEEGLDMDE